MKPKPDDYPAALEWLDAKQQLGTVQEMVRKFGTVSPEVYAAAYERVERAAAAITIPARLMTFRDGDWPGRAPDNVGFTVDALRKREQFRQAQDQWARERRLSRDDFEELQQRQTERGPQRRSARR
ncbi:hypothetical protein F8568_017695 [Actinomadura sp. LD22]|uniref:Uncharacterized protein n=1 Tax=Actinomadura physcomitrii TaxID=2650748 RepID=A0A6I4MCJ7_9ACTN|nr:hypothetical protein [Actinomadura physcomitrii]MWA02175.1 hypothetical protein [Actinomadura physcomitrii]